MREVLKLLLSKEESRIGWVLPAEVMSAKVSVADPDDVDSLWAAVLEVEGVTARAYPSGWGIVIPKAETAGQMTIRPGEADPLWKRFALTAMRITGDADARRILYMFSSVYQVGFQGTRHVRGRQYSVSVPAGMCFGETLLLLADALGMDISLGGARIVWAPRKPRPKPQP
ncbi:MAG: hypothetical protein ACYTF6_08465 [Planctomycetota bacterium]